MRNDIVDVTFDAGIWRRNRQTLPPMMMSAPVMSALVVRRPCVTASNEYEEATGFTNNGV